MYIHLCIHLNTHTHAHTRTYLGMSSSRNSWTASRYPVPLNSFPNWFQGPNWKGGGTRDRCGAVDVPGCVCMYDMLFYMYTSHACTCMYTHKYIHT